MVQCKSNQVCAGANSEKDAITGSDIMPGREVIEQFASQDWEKKTARRARHTTESHNGSNGLFGEHVGNRGEKICGPGLVR